MVPIHTNDSVLFIPEEKTMYKPLAFVKSS